MGDINQVLSLPKHYTVSYNLWLLLDDDASRLRVCLVVQLSSQSKIIQYVEFTCVQRLMLLSSCGSKDEDASVFNPNVNSVI